MKASLLCLALLLTSPCTYAGKMKAIWEMTNESVLEELGFDESLVDISGHRFLTSENKDSLVIETLVTGYDADIQYRCLTTFIKSADFYSVQQTTCSKN